MNRDEVVLLTNVYPIWVINIAKRSLPKNATYGQVKAKCEQVYNANGRKGTTFIEEVKNRL